MPSLEQRIALLERSMREVAETLALAVRTRPGVEKMAMVVARHAEEDGPDESSKARVCKCRQSGADPTEPGLRCVHASRHGCRLEIGYEPDELPLDP